jgi:hypothetical protein
MTGVNLLKLKFDLPINFKLLCRPNFVWSEELKMLVARPHDDVYVSYTRPLRSITTPTYGIIAASGKEIILRYGLNIIARDYSQTRYRRTEM